MRKTLLIISLGMSMAYADSEERSWTEKAMDIGREIKISVEGYIDAFAMSAHDHYNGLIKGADYWYRDGERKGYGAGYFVCYNQSQKTYRDGYDKGYKKGSEKGADDVTYNDNLSADDGDKYPDCFNTDYKEGYRDGDKEGYTESIYP